MAFAIEGRDVVRHLAQTLERQGILKRRKKQSWDHLNIIHILASFLWLVSMFYLPSQAPYPVPYTVRYHLISGLPILFCPFVLAQTYCAESVALYNQYLMRSSWFNKAINFYYPYFGICLFAASVTGGSYLLFLTVTTALVGGFLWTAQQPSAQPARQVTARRRPSLRFSRGTFYSLIALALIISILGTNQLYWLQANVKLKGPTSWSDLIANIPPLPFTGGIEIAQETFADMSLERPESIKDVENAIAKPLKDSAQTAPGKEGTSGTNPTQGTGQQASNAAESLQNAKFTEASGSPNDLESPLGAVLQTEEADAPDLPQDIAQAADDIDAPEGQVSQDSADQLDSPQATDSRNSSDLSQDFSQQPQGTGAAVPSFPDLIQRPGGAFDPEQSTTRIGKTGSITPDDAILFRVAPIISQSTQQPAPAFPLHIREATYNRYDSGTWRAVKPTFAPQASQSGRWIFGSKTPNTASVRISASLQKRKGTLKLPVGTAEINNLTVNTVKKNQYGTVVVQGKPGAIAYTAQFDAAKSFDSPPTQADRDIPQAEQPTLNKILKSLSLKGKSPLATVQAVSTFFKQGFQYSLDLPPASKNTTPLSDFLLENRSGHCEYFASATSLLLRQAGIPTRYTVGYSVHEYSPSEKQYVVRASDAHAWVLAYVNGTWITVDTTPSRSVPEGAASTAGTAEAEGTGQQAQEAESSAGLEAVQDEVNGVIQKDDPLAEQLSDGLSSLIAQSRDGLGPILLLVAVVVVGVAIALYFFFYFAWQLYRKLRPQSSKNAARQRSQPLTQAIEPEFHLIEQRLAEWNLRREPSEPPKQWILRLQQKLPTPQMEELQQIIDLHYRYRFDPQGIDRGDQAKLKTLIQTWLNTYRQRVQVAREGTTL